MRPNKRKPVNCMACGKVFLAKEYEIKQGQGKFCSKVCAYAYRKGRPNPKRRRGEERKCPICGKMFHAKLCKIKEGKGKYCSKACANKGLTKEVSRVCLNCEKTFLVKRNRIERGEGKYCGMACANKQRHSGKDMVCPVCGKTYYLMPSQIKAGLKKYCSKACLHKATSPDNCTCLICGKKFHEQAHRLKIGWGKTCSNKCRGKYLTSIKTGRQIVPRIKRVCNWCGKEFSIIECRLKKEPGKYCSRKCQHLSQIGKRFREYPARLERICVVCGKHFTVPPSVMKKEDSGKYCSRKCKDAVVAQKWADPEYRKKVFAYFGKASREGSKPEIYVYHYISNALKGIEVKFKDWDILGSQEIDISIPSFKVGIEYQGPIHSLPIRGQKQLEKRQEGDKRKRDKMKALGWRLFYIHGPKKLRINELEDACDGIIHQLPSFADWKPPQKRLMRRTYG